MYTHRYIYVCVCIPLFSTARSKKRILSSTCSDRLLTGKPMFLTWNRIDYNTYLLQLPNKSTAHLFSLGVLQQTSFIV